MAQLDRIQDRRAVVTRGPGRGRDRRLDVAEERAEQFPCSPLLACQLVLDRYVEQRAPAAAAEVGTVELGVLRAQGAAVYGRLAAVPSWRDSARVSRLPTVSIRARRGPAIAAAVALLGAGAWLLRVRASVPPPLGDAAIAVAAAGLAFAAFRAWRPPVRLSADGEGLVVWRRGFGRLSWRDIAALRAVGTHRMPFLAVDRVVAASARRTREQELLARMAGVADLAVPIGDLAIAPAKVVAALELALGHARAPFGH